MSDLTRPGALPLRPLTTGELLDGAVVLLRARPVRLIGLGVLLALAEQAVLFPLRTLARRYHELRCQNRLAAASASACVASSSCSPAAQAGTVA